MALLAALAVALPVALPVALAVPTAAAGDWPVSRGSVEAKGVAVADLPAEPDLLWTFTAEGSAFEAEPIVADGVVYLGDADRTFYAIDLATGEVKWKQAFEDSGFAAAAAIAEGKLIVGDALGVVRCLSAKDGETLWAVETESEVYGPPYPYRGLALVTTELGVLHALDLESGEEKWRFTIQAPLRCSPTVVGGRTLLAGCDAVLHAVDLSTGEKVGAVEIGGQTGCTAAADGGRVYFGLETGAFLAVDAPSPDQFGVAWTYHDPRRGQGVRAAAAVGKKVVVYGGTGKALYGIDRASGESVWVKPTRSRIESAPVVLRTAKGDQRAIAATTRGRLMLVNLADGETEWEYDAGGGFVAAPAVADDRLVVGNTDGTLYCFGAMKD